MQEHINIGMAVFRQICEINEIDPQVIQQEAQQQTAAQEENRQAELLIKSALDHRAKTLIRSINLSEEAGNEGKEYSIDGDPAAPSFHIREEFIRSSYAKVDADKLIEVLGQVKLPVQG
jgi:hypothetical protein